MCNVLGFFLNKVNNEARNTPEYIPTHRAHKNVQPVSLQINFDGF